MELEFATSSALHPVRRVLARKYRPRFLRELVGQEWLVQSLERGILEGQLPQALLLHGIRGTGKTSTARILARALNCTGPDGQGGPTPTPCGQCPSCRAFDEDRHPDVLEMDAASHTGVDDIREVIDSAQYRAILGRCKVFIIDEVHMLSKSAFNALLKTLEEPPSHVLFVFATTEINKIPETILSRCARFDLKRVSSKVLMNHFQEVASKEGYTLGVDAAAILARAADGSVRDGLTLLDQVLNLTDATGAKDILSSTIQGMLGVTDRQKVYNVLAQIFDRKAEEVIESVRGLTDEGEDPVAFFQDLLECLYRVACLKMMPRLASDETIPEFERRAAHLLAVRLESLQLLSLWKKMLKGYEDIRRAPFAQQALEMVLLRLCFAAQVPSLETILHGPEPLETEPLRDLKVDKFEQEKSFQDKPSSNEPASTSGSCEFSSVHKKILSLEDLLALLEASREVLLLNYLRRDLAITEICPGRMTVQLKNDNAAKILPLLKQFLFKETGESWTVQVDVDSPAQPSLHEIRLADQQKTQEYVLRSPLLTKLQKEFPDATVSFEFDDDE